MAYQVILTATGAAKLAAGIVNLTHMAVGDGGGSEYQPTGAETALVNEVYRKPLSSYNVTANKVIMQLTIPINDGGFSICEAGIFDNDGDMIYIANLATRYKPAPAEGGASDLSITLVSTVSNIANLSVTVDGTAYVTQTMLTAGLDEKVDKIDDKATDTEAEEAIDGDKFMTPAATYAGYGASDPVVLTTSPHNQLITESILTGSVSPMVINLADVADYPKSKLNRIALTIANFSNKNWTITPAAAGGAVNETLSITGATTAPPAYALDTTSLPTVANGTVASNVFTATANNASAQTFDYVAGGTVESITPKMTFTNGNVLTIDPSSSLGSTKFNYSASNTVQVGSKLLIDVAGVVSEITVASGSQSSNSVFDSGWGTLKFASANGKMFAIGANSKVAVSSDNGATWSYAGQPTTLAAPAGSITIVYFSGAYYAAWELTGATVQYVFKTTDLLNWTTAYTYNANSVNRAQIVTDGVKLRAYFWANSSTPLYVIGSNDGTTWTSVTTLTFTAGTSTMYEARYCNGKYLLVMGNILSVSNDGDTYNNYTVTGGGSDILSAFYDGTLYAAATFNNGTPSICTSPDLTTWTQRRTYGGGEINFFFSDGTNLLLAGVGTTNIYKSSNLTTWTTLTGAVNNNYTGTSNGNYWIIPNSGRTCNQSSNGTTWTSINLDANGYKFTMTSPSITKPDWAALGGQTEQYSVSATSTPSFNTAATPTYTRSGNVITATYAQVTGLSGTHVQLKALTLNSGDVLSQISATLTSGTLQTINGKPSYSLAPGKVALFIPTQSGWLSANTGAISVRKVTANYTMTSNDDVVIIGANNLVITVPDATAVEQGRVYRIKAGDFTGGSIATQSSQTIDGTTPPTLNTLENLAIYSDGSNWLID